MAKRKSIKKRQSRRRVICGGADADPVATTDTDAAATTDTDAAATATTAEGSGSFMSNFFSPTQETSDVKSADVDEAAVESTAVESTAAAAMASTFKSKKRADDKTISTTEPKTKRKRRRIKRGSKKNGQPCETKKTGRCKQWFNMRKNKLCASASPSV